MATKKLVKTTPKQARARLVPFKGLMVVYQSFNPTRSAGAVFNGTDFEWRWRLIANNGRIVADSSEGYERRGQAVTAAHKLLRADLSGVTVKVATEFE